MGFETLTTQQIIDGLQADMESLTDSLVNETATLNTAITAHQTTLAAIEQQHLIYLGIVLNERFTINNKLKYTNDDQRQVAVAEMQSADEDFQSAIVLERTQSESIANQKATLESCRKTFKIKELLLFWYVNS